MEMQEKRKHKRIVYEIPVDCISEKVSQFKKSKNVSLGGIFLETQAIEPEGTRVKLTLSFPELKEGLEAEGVVIWSRFKPNQTPSHQVRPPGMGIMFTKITEHLRVHIEDFTE